MKIYEVKERKIEKWDMMINEIIVDSWYRDSVIIKLIQTKRERKEKEIIFKDRKAYLSLLFNRKAASTARKIVEKLGFKVKRVIL